MQLKGQIFYKKANKVINHVPPGGTNQTEFHICDDEISRGKVNINTKFDHFFYEIRLWSSKSIPPLPYSYMIHWADTSTQLGVSYDLKACGIFPRSNSFKQKLARHRNNNSSYKTRHHKPIGQWHKATRPGYKVFCVFLIQFSDH